MADVFISYSKRHRGTAEEFATFLQTQELQEIDGTQRRLTVWWDASLAGGEPFAKRIVNELDSARVVLVIWSDAAVNSDWVYAEAARGASAGKLVSAMAAGLDPARIPLPFGALHTELIEDRTKVLSAIQLRYSGKRSEHPNVIRSHNQRGWVLEPKHEPLPPRAALRRPASLLLAKHRVVPFDDIHGLVSDFIAWSLATPEWAPGCLSLGRLVHGAGGLGKTRLLIEVCETLTCEHGWLTGFLPRDVRGSGRELTERQLEHLILGGGDARGLLIVVDYAESRQDDVQWLAERLVRRGEQGAAPARLVLLSRGAGEWWRSLAQKSQYLQELCAKNDDYDVVEIPESIAQQNRAAMFTSSLNAFMDIRRAAGLHVPSGSSIEKTNGALLTEEDYSRPLAVHMAALLHAYSAEPTADHREISKLLEKILGLEYELWDKSLGTQKSQSTAAALKRAVAQTTLATGLSTASDVLALLRRDPFYEAAADTSIVVIRSLLQTLFPAHGDGVEALEPDLIGEHHVASVTEDELVDACLDWADDRLPYRRAILTVLNRAARQEHGPLSEKARRALARLIATRSELLMQDLVDVSVSSAGALAALLADSVSRLSDLARNQLYVATRREVVQLIKGRTRRKDLRTEAVNRLLAAVSDADHLAQQESLNMLERIDGGEDCIAQGQFDRAIQQLEEAVAIARKLPSRFALELQPFFARALNNLGVALSLDGKRRAAADVAQEVVSVYGALAERDPDAFDSNFADALVVHGKRLAEVGEFEHALTQTEQAVALYHSQPALQMNAERPNLAAALVALSERYSEVERAESSLASIEESVQLYRQLSDTGGDQFKAERANALHTRAKRLFLLRGSEPAVKAAEEALSLFRELASRQQDPFVYRLGEVRNDIESWRTSTRNKLGTSDTPRVFLAYSRKDGTELAAQLRRDLEAKGLRIWTDLVALEGGRDWWTQIEDALRSKTLQHLLLVVTPGALQSPILRREIRLARAEGKTLCPVKGPGLGDLAKLPRWIGQLYDPDIPEHRTTLQHVLERPSYAKRVVFMAPELPTDFVARPAEFDALKRTLLDAKGDAVATTTALRGAGGYGKTTLANALAHDPDIQEAYFDGVLWVELGEQGGGRIVSLISDLTALVTGESTSMATIDAARVAFAEALGDRRFLLVIDDVWQRAHLEPFLHGGPNTSRLVTTRLDSVLPDTAVRQSVAAMNVFEARALLCAGIPSDLASPFINELAQLANKLHELPLLLRLANGFLRDRVIKHRQPLVMAIQEARHRLAAKGLPAFDDRNRRYESLAAAIDLNLDLLDADARVRFGELCIFPEDADIPIGIVVRMWKVSGDLDEFATHDLLAQLSDLSLLLDLDLDSRTVRLHSATREYLRQQTTSQALTAQHKLLVSAMGAMEGGVQADTDYFFRYLPLHLASAGNQEALDKLLLDPAWLKAKLETTGSPVALISDYEQYAHGQMQDLIGRTLRLIAGICARDGRQLLPQLLGRLIGRADPNILLNMRRLVSRPALLALRPTLTQAGAETSRLEGHTGWVDALVVLPDGRLASGSQDRTLRIWDLATGAEIARLEGHEGAITTLAVLPNGVLASGSDDKTIRLWNLATRTEIGRLEGHEAAVNALAILPDGRVVSASDDRTVRLWDTTKGVETARLEGHTGSVRALAVLPYGALASASFDKTIRVWDATAGLEIARLIGHTDGVTTLTFLPEGRIASGSRDRTIRLWDPHTGAEIARLEGHTGWIWALTALAEDRLASSGDDGTIRIWHVATGVQGAGLQGHVGGVLALAVLPDGRLASGASDNTIRFWDPVSSPERTRVSSHKAGVTALTQVSGECLASGSSDATIRLWTLATGAEIALLTDSAGAVTTLAALPAGRLASSHSDHTICVWDIMSGRKIDQFSGHSGEVTALAAFADGRLASGSQDSTIRVWDFVTGLQIRLTGHDGGVTALAVLHDGRLVSAGSDNTIRVWAPDTGNEIVRLHSDGFTWALAVLPNGRLASGAGDNTIRLWDLTTATESARLIGHTGGVLALTTLASGDLASASDDRTVRIWDPTTGIELARLECDAPIHSLAPILGHGDLVCGDRLGRIHWLELVQ